MVNKARTTNLINASVAMAGNSLLFNSKSSYIFISNSKQNLVLNTWIIDNGAFIHMCHEKSSFKKFIFFPYLFKSLYQLVVKLLAPKLVLLC